MIGVVVFYLHVIGLVAVFTRNYMRGGVSEGLLGAAFFALIFTVGWTFASFLLKLVISAEGFATWCDRNTLALMLLTILEYVLYRMYFWDYLFRAEAPSKK